MVMDWAKRTIDAILSVNWDNFKVEEKIKSANDKRTEKLKAEKKAAEDREKALMATEE